MVMGGNIRKNIHTNYVLYGCLVFGAISNVYLLMYMKHLQSIGAEKRVQCQIDSEILMNLIETRNPHEHTASHELIARPKFEKTLQTYLFAFGGGSGLGNKLFEIIALRGISDTLNRTPVINVINADYVQTILNKIQPIFPSLVDQIELRVIPESSVVSQQANFGACCKFDDPMKWKNRSEEHLLLYGHYFQSYKYFQHLKHNIRKWLSPTAISALRAETLIPENHRDDFKICTHVRRGDFQYDGVHQPSDAHFTRAATDFLVEQYQVFHKNVTVVVLGNDIKFAHTVFQDLAENYKSLEKSDPNLYNYTLPVNPTTKYTVLLTPTLTPEIDLALSRLYCDVTLITAPSSTFGWWLSYLAKPGAITYYRDIIESKDGVANEMKEDDFYPPEWTKLKTGLNGKIRKFR